MSWFSSSAPEPEPEYAPWPEFTAKPMFEGDGKDELVPNLTEFSVEVPLEADVTESLDKLTAASFVSTTSVFYEFSTVGEQGYGFSGSGLKGNMGFRLELVNSQRPDDPMVLLETKVYRSHLQTVRGEAKLPRLRNPCKLVLIFDNTHSLIKDKTLAYKFAVVLNEHIKGRGDAKDEGPKFTEYNAEAAAARGQAHEEAEEGEFL